MDNERPNERTLWSRRLEQPGALPRTGLTDKEAAWDKLYDRLKESDPPRRKRMIWLWAAAACLLLMVVPAALLLKDGQKPSRQDPQPIPVAISSGKEQPTPQDKLSSHPPVAVNPRQSAGRVDPGKGIDPGKSSAYTRLRPKAPENAVLTHFVSGQPGHPTSAESARPTMTHPNLEPAGGQLSGTEPCEGSDRGGPCRSRSSEGLPSLDSFKLLAHGADTLTLVFAPRPDLSKPLTVAAVVPPKKGQRVVHINEIEPAQPTPATVKGPRQKPGGLRFGLAPQETFRPSTTYVEPEAHSILSPNAPLVRWP